MSFLLPINGRSSVSLIFWHKEWTEQTSSSRRCPNSYFDKTQMSEQILEPGSLSACRIEFNPISVNIMEFEREFIIKEAARANVTTLVNNHRSRIKNVTGGSVAEMRLMVNVGSFVITIIMPRLVSACQRMAESVTLWPGVNSYEGVTVTHHTESVGRVWWRWPELLLLWLGTMSWMLSDSSRVFNVLAASFCWERDIMTLRDVTWHMTDRWSLSSVLRIMEPQMKYSPCTLHLNCFNKPHSEVSTLIFNDVYFSDSSWRVMAEPLQIDVMLQVKNWRIETFYSNAYWGSIVTFVRRNWQVKFGSDQREPRLIFSIYTLFVRVTARRV